MSLIPAWLRQSAALLGFFFAMPLAWADGTLTHMSGTVSIYRADGKTVPGAIGTRAYPGDTVVTATGAYVRMEMTDGGEIVLRPDSELKIDAYKFVETRPAEDSFVFSMLKGGLRTATGLIGKRGNRDAYELKTRTATIGIRGTKIDLRVCQASCGALADGTYLAVRSGAVQMTNTQGTLPVAAGQVAFSPPLQPPIILPRDPGIGFTPPPMIPKLDEKKKVQTAAAAPPDQPKPGGGSGQSSQATQRGAETTAKTETSQESDGKSDKPGADAGSRPGAQAQPVSPTPLPSTPAAQPASGMSCSVQ